MDKSWIHCERSSKEFHEGLCLFLNYAFENGFVTEDNKVKCPCKECANVGYKTRDEIYDDVVSYGMLRSYTLWYHHGENFRTTFPSGLGAENTNVDQEISETDVEEVGDDITGMLQDAYGLPTCADEGMSDMLDAEMNGMPSDSSAAQFYKLLEDSKKPLYPGCDKPMLSFLVRFWNYKCIGGMSDKSFKEMLQLMRESFPEGCTLPENFTQCKKVLSQLGLSYNKIDACPNDCMLYYKETADYDSCTVCKASRYKDGRLKTPAKILRYFPLKPRLQRLYMCSKTAKDMRWHAEERTRDGVLRHPADSEAWRVFDDMNPTFAADSRNIRLGLSTDGFSPYSSMRNPHSTWPVVLLPYNLPPWLCMKQPNMILSMLIPGPHSPGNDIDVYLRPLIDELKELWEEGLDTFDSSRNEMFNLRAGLLWTISDYPGLAMLSGWSNKGKLACSTCLEETRHQWLKNGRKTVYMGHRRFLPRSHRFRTTLKKEFDGKVELSPPPNILLGPDILSLLKDIPHTFGKQFEEILGGDRPRKRKSRVSSRASSNMPSNWKKLSIFYELPYWENNILKHNIDVMHTEKNVCDSVLGTIMDIPGKTKDGLKARFDLQLLKIRPELHPQLLSNGKYFLPGACYFMDNARKTMFLNVLKNLKTPDGYSAYIARCVNVQQRKIFGLKSHDSHVLMQQLLPLAFRKTLPSKVSKVLMELSSFFRELCSKVSRPEDFAELEKRIVIIVCELERIFPPAFFDIMVHLPIHLATEARLGGPVQYRWMYPIERYLYTLKKYVRNKTQPEGSIAEGYLADECVTFLSRYLKDIESRTNRPPRYVDDTPIGKGKRFPLTVQQQKKMHDYILSNDEDVAQYIAQHKTTLAMVYPRMSDLERLRKHKLEFADWFKNHIRLLTRSKVRIAEGLDLVAEGPFSTARQFTGYTTQGYNFKVVSKENGAKTQNSGVVVDSTAPSFRNGEGQNTSNDMERTYYGVLTNIIELTYRQGRSYVLFECNWANVVNNSGRTRTSGLKTDNLGFVLVNFNHLLGTQREEPYVLASQCKQVFYAKDPVEPEWDVVLRTKPRDIYDMGDDNPDQLLDHFPVRNVVNNEEDDSAGLLNDENGVVVDAPTRTGSRQICVEEEEAEAEEEEEEVEEGTDKEVESEEEEYVDGLSEDDNDGPDLELNS